MNVSVETVKLLRRGLIAGWFQGRMEIGPRFLGGRSILAGPTLEQMKDKINADVKFRESLRPFAPSSPNDLFKKYFDSEVERPFMLKMYQVQEEAQKLVAARL